MWNRVRRGAMVARGLSRGAWEAARPGLLAVLAVLAALSAEGALAEEPPSAEPRYAIAVHISSDPASGGPEEVTAIRDFVSARARVLNEAGGIDGRPLDIVFLDDAMDVARTVANVDRALADPHVIAMVGVWNSTRGAQVMERVGRSGIPLISEISVETLFAPYPNIYTLTRSVADEQDVFTRFAKEKASRLAFVGLEDDLYTRAYYEHIKGLGAELPIVSELWIKGDLDAQSADIGRAIEEIKAQGADLVFLSIGSKRGGALLKRMAEAGIESPAFIALGSINGVVADPVAGARDYSGALYEIAEGGVANLNNERLEELMRSPERMPAIRRYSPYAVGYGARYADLIALIADAAGRSVDKSPAAVARHVAAELAELREGRRVWRGWAQDWSFTPKRASSERSLLVWRPKGQEAPILAPLQYVRSGAGLVRVPVLYVHLDMVRIFHVDSGQKSFEAEFFFTIGSAENVPISAIDFTNAVRSPETAAPLIHIREVDGTPAGAATYGTRIYKVSGRFLFEPDLGKYPFDEQIFSISFQPASTAAAFFLQPPSERVRAQTFGVDGWKVRHHYVGTDELIIRSIGGPLGDERIIPYYNFNYTWVMQRQVIDYVLRVIVPLSFIMIVAYVAIFIPRSEFEAIMGIQVTALLSSIALYLALNQPSSDDATLSDVIFVTAYATISVMIALSVLEVNTTLSRSPAFLHAVHVLQVYLVPVAALAVITYVLASASGGRAVAEFLGRGAT